MLDNFTKQYHKEPKGKLPKPSDLMDLVNVQLAEDDNELTEEEIATMAVEAVEETLEDESFIS